MSRPIGPIGRLLTRARAWFSGAGVPAPDEYARMTRRQKRERAHKLLVQLAADGGVRRGAAVDAFRSPGSGIGEQGRDRAEERQVAPPVRLTQQELTWLWESSQIIKRACSKRAQVALKRGAQLSVEEGQTAYLDEELLRLDGLAFGQEGVSWGNLYGGALVWAVTSQGDPSTPIGESDLGEVTQLRVIDRHQVRAISYASASQHKGPGPTPTRLLTRDGRPEIYHLTRTGHGGALDIHHSRVFRFDGHRLPWQGFSANGGWHAPVVTALFRAAGRYDIGVKALSTMLEDCNVGLWKIPGWDDLITSDEEDVLDWLDAQVLYRSILGDYAVDADGGDFGFIARPLEDAVKVMGVLREDLASEVDMPATELFGTAPAGLSTDDTSGRKKWYSDIDATERPLLGRYIGWLCGILQQQPSCPEALRGQVVTVTWPSLEVRTAAEEDDSRVKRAEESVALLEAGTVTKEEVRRRLEDDPTWELNPDADLEDTLPPLEKLRQGRLVAQAGMLHLEEEVANFFRGVLGMDAWTPAARERWLELVRMGVLQGAPGGSADGGRSTDAEEPSRVPPKAAQEAARKVLRWREEHPDEIQGMTEVGWRRAQQLASGEALSWETIGRIAQFARHQDNGKLDPEHDSAPWRDAGYVAWLGWGGDSAILSWAPRLMEWRRGREADAARAALPADPRQVGWSCDGLDGDGSKVGLFLPLPPELASQRPLLPEDDSPAHVTLLYVGDVRRREAELLEIVREVAAEHPFACRGTLGQQRTLTSHASQLVVYQDVYWEDGNPHRWQPSPIERFREALVARLRQMGFGVADIGADQWLPHLTLAYLDDPHATWSGAPCVGSWHVDRLEVWGLPRPETTPSP